MGLVGGMLPAIRAARLPVVTALQRALKPTVVKPNNGGPEAYDLYPPTRPCFGSRCSPSISLSFNIYLERSPDPLNQAAHGLLLSHCNTTFD